MPSEESRLFQESLRARQQREREKTPAERARRACLTCGGTNLNEYGYCLNCNERNKHE